MANQRVLFLTFDARNCSAETLDRLVEEPTTSSGILDAVARAHRERSRAMLALILHPNVRPETLFYLYNHGPKEVRAVIVSRKGAGNSGSTISEASTSETALVEVGTRDAEALESMGPESEAKSAGSLIHRLQNMKVAEKVQFALHAPKDARMIMIRDSNRIVAMAVIHSPKLTEDEVVLIAQSRNVSEDVLREVAKNREWMKNYQVIRALVNNPKTPIGTALPLLNLLQNRDLTQLSKNRNVPEGLRRAGGRVLAARVRG